MPPTAVLPQIRWVESIDFNGPIATNNPELGPCWIWLGKDKNPYGHGIFHVGYLPSGKRVRTSAHKYGYEAAIGPVPDGLDLDHFACDNPPCCNPHHVRPASRRENNLRGRGFAAIQMARTHCPQGHPFDEENTYLWRGQRQCRECKRAWNRRYRRRQA